jgi:hypothetical protein
MARRLWPNERAGGKRLRWGSDGRYTVVGVVGDVKDGDLAAEMQPTFYLSAVRDRRPTPILILRTVIDPRAIAATARRAIAEVAPDVPVVAAEPMTTIIARSTANQRFRTALISLFGVLAAALAAVGIYGVTARNGRGRGGARRGHAWSLRRGARPRAVFVRSGLDGPCDVRWSRDRAGRDWIDRVLVAGTPGDPGKSGNGAP